MGVGNRCTDKHMYQLPMATTGHMGSSMLLVTTVFTSERALMIFQSSLAIPGGVTASLGKE